MLRFGSVGGRPTPGLPIRLLLPSPTHDKEERDMARRKMSPDNVRRRMEGLVLLLNAVFHPGEPLTNDFEVLLERKKVNKGGSDGKA